jgi:hypothetical protein
MSFSWSHSGRKSGRTTALAEWAKKNNGIIVCATAAQAEEIGKTHGVRAMTLFKLIQDGVTKPWIPDTTAFEAIAAEKEKAAVEVYKWKQRALAAEAELEKLKEVYYGPQLGGDFHDI